MEDHFQVHVVSKNQLRLMILFIDSKMDFLPLTVKSYLIPALIG